MNVTKSDLLAHARQCLAENPEMTGRELQAELEAYYLQSTNYISEMAQLIGKSALPMAGLPIIGAVNSPGDWLRGGALILKAAAKIIATKKIDDQSAAEVIEGVVIIVTKDSNGGDKRKPK